MVAELWLWPPPRRIAVGFATQLRNSFPDFNGRMAGSCGFPLHNLWMQSST